jgi:uncharacterized protein
VPCSGGYRRGFISDGRRVSHIIDPRTGQPAESIALADALPGVVSLLIVLFFAATGVTLNHPSGRRPSAPMNWPARCRLVEDHHRHRLAGGGRIPAHDHGVHGTVSDRTDDSRRAVLTFRAPGYKAVAFIDLPTGAYTVTVSPQGLIGVMNDLLRGRDAGRAWAWLIDVLGGLLVLLSLAGLGLLFYLKNCG